MLESHPDGVVLRVRVHPGARKNEVRGTQAEALKVSLTTAPERGKANKSLIELLSKFLKIRKSHLEILSGETSSQKKLLVRDISPEELREKLAPFLQ